MTSDHQPSPLRMSNALNKTGSKSTKTHLIHSVPFTVVSRLVNNMTILQQLAIVASLMSLAVVHAGLPPGVPIFPQSPLRPPLSHDHGFRYSVNDYNGNEHSHQQQKVGNVVTGQYKVLLPDGRLQTVTYIADENGYRAKVEYSPYHPGEGATAGLPSAANLRPPLIPIQQHQATPIIDNHNRPPLIDNRFPRPFQSLTALEQEQKQQQLGDRNSASLVYAATTPFLAPNDTPNPNRRMEKKDSIFSSGQEDSSLGVRQHQSPVILISPERGPKDGAITNQPIVAVTADKGFIDTRYYSRRNNENHRFVPDYNVAASRRP